MSWLRIDDGFTTHPKLLELGPPAARWAWLEILAWCAQHHTEGHIPEHIGDITRRATPALLTKAETIGLIDRDPDGNRVVHDWQTYNGSTGNRVTDYLQDHPEASANQVFRAIGGNRNLVLSLVSEYRNSGTGDTENGTEKRYQKRYTRVRPQPQST